MSRTIVRRGLMASAAAAAALALGAAPALAHHCFVPMYGSLDGPQSPNWFVASAEAGAMELAGWTTPCDEARDAGYDALRAAGLPVGIKIFGKMTIGDPKEEGRMNPNGADGHGLEYFGAGSTLPEEMVGTYIGAASEVVCD